MGLSFFVKKQTRSASASLPLFTARDAYTYPAPTSYFPSIGILANLEARISSAEPLAYTYLNTVLVAVNPLKVLNNQPQPTE